MKVLKTNGFILMLAMGLSAPTLVLAQDPAPEDPEVETLNAGEENVSGKIADDFSAFAGDDADTLVETLRNGGELTYERQVLDENGEPVLIEVPVVAEEGQPANEDGFLVDDEGNVVLEQVPETETVTVETTGMGYGEISLALGLSEALLGDGAEFGDIVDSLDTILAARADGSGWGQIFRDQGYSVGEVISAIKSRGASNAGRFADSAVEPGQDLPEPTGAPAQGQQNRPNNVGAGDRPTPKGHGIKPDRPLKPQTVERPARPERPVKPETFDRPVKPERPDRPDRP